MNPCIPQRPDPAKGLTERIRAMKDDSDRGLHTDSGSETDTPNDERHSSIASQSEDRSGDDNDDEKYEDEEQASDKTSRTRSHQKY